MGRSRGEEKGQGGKGREGSPLRNGRRVGRLRSVGGQQGDKEGGREVQSRAPPETGPVQGVEQAKGWEVARDSIHSWATAYAGTALALGPGSLAATSLSAFCTKAAEIHVPLRSTSLPLTRKCWRKTSHFSSLIKMSQEGKGKTQQGKCPPAGAGCAVTPEVGGCLPGVTGKGLGNQRIAFLLRTLESHLSNSSRGRLRWTCWTN